MPKPVQDTVRKAFQTPETKKPIKLIAAKSCVASPGLRSRSKTKLPPIKLNQGQSLATNTTRSTTKEGVQSIAVREERPSDFSKLSILMSDCNTSK